MAFTAQELQNITNASLDYFMDKGKVWKQTIQNKPLLRDMRAMQKTFPGGKEFISVAVKGEYTAGPQGYSHNDTVTYDNPAFIKRARYPWFEHHKGIQVTLTELKHDGISVTDSTTGESTSNHSKREMHALANLLEDKLEDMSESYARGMNNFCWRDGTADPKALAGIKSIIVDTPSASAVVGGLDQSQLSFWRNRVSLGVSTNPANQPLAKLLDTEYRQLRRFAKNPKHKCYAGSDFLDALLAELRANGVYTQTGWSGKGGIDMSAADPRFKGMTIEYDPTLDDEGEAKRLYVIDMDAIRLMPMEGEIDKKHAPARPESQYVIFRAITWTGGLACRQRNTSGVYSIA